MKMKFLEQIKQLKSMQLYPTSRKPVPKSEAQKKTSSRVKKAFLQLAEL